MLTLEQASITSLPVRISLTIQRVFCCRKNNCWIYFMVFRYSRKIPQRNSPTNFTGRILLGKPVASRLINSPHFMGSEVLSSHSKRPATLQCPEPHKFCPRTHTILQIYFNIILSASRSSKWALSRRFCCYYLCAFSFSLYVLRALRISFSF